MILQVARHRIDGRIDPSRPPDQFRACVDKGFPIRRQQRFHARRSTGLARPQQEIGALAMIVLREFILILGVSPLADIACQRPTMPSSPHFNQRFFTSPEGF